MEGFKKWFEDQQPINQTVVSKHWWQKKASDDQTVDYQPKHSASTSVKSQHTLQNTRPQYGSDDSGNFSDPFEAKISNLLAHVDPHLRSRAKDGSNMSGFSGSLGYAAPEEMEKITTPKKEYNLDVVEELLKRCANQFVWLDKHCLNVMKLWLKFRSMLHMNEAVNPVLYKVNIMRADSCEKVFVNVEREMKQCKEAKYSELIKTWNTFYSAWNDLLPTLKHYLTNFEQNSRAQQ